MQEKRPPRPRVTPLALLQALARPWATLLRPSRSYRREFYQSLAASVSLELTTPDDPVQTKIELLGKLPRAAWPTEAALDEEEVRHEAVGRKVALWNFFWQGLFPLLFVASLWARLALFLPAPGPSPNTLLFIGLFTPLLYLIGWVLGVFIQAPLLPKFHAWLERRHPAPERLKKQYQS